MGGCFVARYTDKALYVEGTKMGCFVVILLVFFVFVMGALAGVIFG